VAAGGDDYFFNRAEVLGFDFGLGEELEFNAGDAVHEVPCGGVGGGVFFDSEFVPCFAMEVSRGLGWGFVCGCECVCGWDGGWSFSGEEGGGWLELECVRDEGMCCYYSQA